MSIDKENNGRTKKYLKQISGKMEDRLRKVSGKAVWWYLKLTVTNKLKRILRDVGKDRKEGHTIE